jgi:hypothetical protein
VTPEEEYTDEPLEVTGCHDCPFLGKEEEQHICNLIAFLHISWKDGAGFDELYEQKILPTACPLKSEPITVVLKN